MQLSDEYFRFVFVRKQHKYCDMQLASIFALQRDTSTPSDKYSAEQKYMVVSKE